MARSVRVIVKNKLYEVVTRARNSLPLPPNQLTNTVVSGIISRTQRYDEVILCNYVWMNNHSHKHLIPKTPSFFPRFYGEISKKITDSIRAMLGENSLRIWEDRATVMVLAQLEDCIRRLIYIFTNPTKAGLVDTIEEYPGLNSWNAFISCPPSVEAEVSIDAPWYPVANLPRLKTRNLSDSEAQRLSEELSTSAEFVPHKLIVKPLAWLSQFGITEEKEIEVVRQKVILGVRQLEEEYRVKRALNNEAVLGAKRARTIPFMKPHVPKKRERKIFLICSNKELRIKLLEFFEGVFIQCRECYERTRRGFSSVWPPGTFIPWLPPVTSCGLEHVCI